jgi:hypothetical protein
VEILNGTVENGLAGRTAELFRGFGYDIISTGNADRNDYEQTIIIDRSGIEEAVLSFAEIIHCQNIRYEALPPEPDEVNIQNLDYRSDFTLVLGRDFRGRYVTN